MREMALGRYMREEVRDIGEVGSLWAEGALQGDRGRISLRDQVHWCNGGHRLGSEGQRFGGPREMYSHHCRPRWGCQLTGNETQVRAGAAAGSIRLPVTALGLVDGTS
jgi:hypothetical protein